MHTGVDDIPEELDLKPRGLYNKSEVKNKHYERRHATNKSQSQSASC